MPFTQTDLDNINAAIASGELSVEINGRKVAYRSISELIKARGIIESDLAQANPQATRRGAYRVTFATHRDH